MTENFHIGCINCAVIWKRLFGKKSIWERVFGNSNTKTHFKIADLKEDIVNSNVSYCASFALKVMGKQKDLLMMHYCLPKMEKAPAGCNTNCVKSVQIRSYFWSVFSCIRTEYGKILRISPYSVKIQENTEQK